MGSLQGFEDQLAFASMSAHRILSRANAVALTKPDASLIRGLMASVVICLMSIEEDLVPQKDIQDLAAALDSCVAALVACVKIVSPAGCLLFSGPLARRIRQKLGAVASALDSLCATVNSLCGSDLGTPAGLRHAELQVLDQRVARAEALKQQLAAVEPSDGGAAAACVRRALQGEGVPEAELNNPQSQAKLADDLFELGHEAEQWLSSEELELVTRCASALLYTEPDNKARGSIAAASDGGSVSSPAAAPSPAVAARLVVQRSFLCPITQSLMRDPVTTESGHTYERSAIEGWLRTSDKDPNTGQQLVSKALTPNWAVKGAIDEWLAAAGTNRDDYEKLTESGDVTVPVGGNGSGSSPPRGGAAAGPGGSSGSSPSPTAATVTATVTTVAGSEAPAYSTFGGIQEWGQVTDVDVAAKEYLRGKGISPAVVQALVEVTGAISMPDLLGGVLGEAHVDLLQLRPADHELLLLALRSVKESLEPRLMSYVTVAPGYASNSVRNTEGGPLCSGSYGVVIMDDRTGEKPLLVRSLQEPYNTWWYSRDALMAAPLESAPAELLLILAGWSEHAGAPVTPFTSRRGMIVRRGHDWLNSDDVNGQDGEVGMLAESTMGLRWLVYWAKGGQGTYHTGADNKFELGHLQVYPLSGAPVVDEDEMTPGSAVVHSLCRPSRQRDDDGSQVLGSVQVDTKSSVVRALWPDHTVTTFRALTGNDFTLNYCARPGEPVTVFNAQAGLKVVRGRDWKWASQDGDGSVGMLVRPYECADEGVWWQVDWPAVSYRYRVGRTPSGTWCDLQVSAYESAGDSGWLLSGTPVMLAPDYTNFGDARDGPLKPGEVGIVTRDVGPLHYVYNPKDLTHWWYDRPALRPLPGKLAADKCQRIKMNRDGRAAFPGKPGCGIGGDTGKDCQELFYCGTRLGQCRCGRCDEQCGPTSGCPCYACVELIGKRVGEDGRLVDCTT